MNNEIGADEININHLGGLWTLYWQEESASGNSGYAVLHVTNKRFVGGDSEFYANGWFDLNEKLKVHLELGRHNGQHDNPEANSSSILRLRLDGPLPQLPQKFAASPSAIDLSFVSVRDIKTNFTFGKGKLKVTLTKCQL